MHVYRTYLRLLYLFGFRRLADETARRWSSLSVMERGFSDWKSQGALTFIVNG